MIYIEWDSNNRIVLQHFFPFHETEGLGKTEAELLMTGALVESIPEPVPQAGYCKEGLYINPETKELYYNYAPIPKTDAQRISELETLVLQLGGLI